MTVDGEGAGPDVVESGPRPLSRRRAGVVVAGLVIVAAAVAVPIAWHHRDSHLSPTVLHPTRAAERDLSYDVAPPPIPPESIPPPPLPVCRVSGIRTSAVLRAAPGEVVGVVTARGGTCHFPVRMAPVALVAGGQVLSAVRLEPDPDRVNPATDIAAPALAVGRVSLGFAWVGSWCGAPADSVRLSYGRRTLDVALTGPQPACDGGRSASMLIPGTVGDVGEPVQAAPASWRALSATLSVRPNSHDAGFRGLQVTFANSSPHPVALAPIPTYIVGVEDDLGDGAPAEVEAPLPYPAGRLVVPAGGTLILDLPPTSYAADRRNLRTGFPITVTFAIAGVPDATARTTVR